MSHKTIYTRCQTLRLDALTDDLLTEAAYDRRTTKAAYIRAAIRGAIRQSLEIQNPLPRRIRQEANL